MRLDSMQGRKVIIVEDELLVAWGIEGLLETLGLQVVGIYASGEDALAADLQDVQLAVIDINLGRGMNGMEFASELRRKSSIPLVFCSAYSDDVTRNRVEQTVPGAKMVAKPVSGGDLGDAIASVVALEQ